jgi:beta-lactamase class A
MSPNSPLPDRHSHSLHGSLKFGLLTSLLSVLLAPSPAIAAYLSTWSFDHNRLDFMVDQRIQPVAQLIANPTRLVIDLPGTKLGRSKIEQTIGQTVQSIRIGQLNAQTTRLVVELAPGYTLDPKQLVVRGVSSKHWLVDLPAPQPVASSAASSEPQAVATLPVSDSRFSNALHQPFTWLQTRILALQSDYSDLKTGMFFVDLQTGNYLDFNGDGLFPAASIIKLPILIAFFQDVDAGKINPNEILTMRADLVASGSGDMQDLPVGSRFSALETVTKMITISDNTATNMILDRIGGINVINQRMQSWGLEDTQMHNILPDLSGTNVTTARDLVYLLGLVNQGKLVSAQSRAQVLDILSHTINRSLLVAGLGAGARIAHKTGDIGFAIGDVGLIQMPSGRLYLAAVLLERPYDDPRGRDFIQQISRIVYSYLNDATAAVSPSR